VDSLRKALLALPEAYREAVVLCDLQEMSYEQASVVMECSAGTVASRLHRAHKMLKARLSHIALSNREKRNSHV
jgi:RNA polymerase sigma-70 factor, ECF subfamily